MKKTLEQRGGNAFTLEGMDLRDYFAACALQALLNGKDPANPGNKNEFFATAAYEYADAMIKVRAE